MSFANALFVLAAGDNEDTFWIQLLVVVILAAGVGIYGMVKSRAERLKRELSDEAIENIIEQPALRIKRRDLTSGMELLARDFLVGIVEQTGAVDQRDIAMRRLCFAELAHRSELWAVSSEALRVYTLDEEGFYGKSIRCEAMQELASRTGKTMEKTGDTAAVHAGREIDG